MVGVPSVFSVTVTPLGYSRTYVWGIRLTPVATLRGIAGEELAEWVGFGVHGLLAEAVEERPRLRLLRRLNRKVNSSR